MTSAFPSLPRRPTAPQAGVTKSPSIYLRSSSTLPAHSSVSSLNSLFANSLSNSPGSTGDEDCKPLILRAFVPHVAVHVSNDTNELAREKGFADFKEMLKPYGEDIPGRITIRDSQGISSSYDDYGIRFVSLSDIAASGERWETGASRVVNGNSTSEKQGSKDGVFQGGSIEEVEELVNLHMERAEEHGGAGISPSDDPPTGKSFYTLYLRRLLSALPLSPHETFPHPVACVIAISSRNTSPIEALRNLYTSGTQVPLPNYANMDYLRYYVLVHDEDRDEIKKSNALFDQMKKHFGLHCHLLRLRSGGRAVISDDDAVVVPKTQWIPAAQELSEINSKDADYGEEQPALCLPDSDATSLQTMIREMAQVSIIPFMERCVATWNDQVASRRRGLSGRFLSMSKRYFGGSSSRNSASASNYDPLSASYHPSTPEAQMRKLADYAFLLRDFRLAHGVYDLLRTDFNNDKAWKYHAGAQEMAAISLILTGTGLTSKVRADTITPMLDLSTYSYLARCSSTYSALRALLVSVELLRLRGGGAADEAAIWATRARDMLTAGSIAHALITERVGACYSVREGVGTGAWGARKRKAAMWKMLAAGEWLDVGKMQMSRRCLDVALGVYDGTGFGHISDFIGAVKRQAGYTPLIDVLDSNGTVDCEGSSGEEEEEGFEVQSEMLDAASKRKSVIGGVMRPELLELETGAGVDDSFITEN